MVVLSVLESEVFLIEHDASPGISGSIVLLFLRENVSLPVGELFALRDAIAEEVGIEFGKTHILNAKFIHVVLQVDEATRTELSTLMELKEVIMPRETNLLDLGRFEQLDDRSTEPYPIETKKETGVMGADLKESNLIGSSFSEDRTSLSIEAKEVLLEQIVNSLAGITLRDNDNLATRKDDARQGANLGLIVFAI